MAADLAFRDRTIRVFNTPIPTFWASHPLRPVAAASVASA